MKISYRIKSTYIANLPKGHILPQKLFDPAFEKQ
jgi:hypothetical protein